MNGCSNGMDSRPVLALALALAGLLLGGCTESQRPTVSGEGNIRGLHAMPTAPDVTFLIEEQTIGDLSYREVSGTQTFDDLTYNFNFDTRLPGDPEVHRIASQSLSVVPDTDYVLAVTGTLEAPSIVLWETPVRQWSGSETVFEASAGHLAPSLGAVDVYLDAPGTAPAAGQARGSLAPGEKLPPFEVESGNYVLTITAAGDPSSILFTSTSQALGERTSQLFVIQEADPSITSGIGVQRVAQDGSSSQLADARFPPTRRFFHAAPGTTAFDVVVDDDFAAPVAANVAYGAISPDVAVPAGESTFTFTQAGNSGVTLHEAEDTIIANSRSTTFLVGAPGELELVSFADNRRPLADLAKFRATLVSSSLEQADIYLLDAGTDIADASPGFSGIDSLTSTGYLRLTAGSYELTVTTAGEKTVLAGPVALDLAGGDVVEMAIIDTADPNVLDAIIYDN